MAVFDFFFEKQEIQKKMSVHILEIILHAFSSKEKLHNRKVSIVLNDKFQLMVMQVDTSAN